MVLVKQINHPDEWVYLNVCTWTTMKTTKNKYHKLRFLPTSDLASYKRRRKHLAYSFWGHNSFSSKFDLFTGVTEITRRLPIIILAFTNLTISMSQHWRYSYTLTYRYVGMRYIGIYRSWFCVCETHPVMLFFLYSDVKGTFTKLHNINAIVCSLL